MTGAAEAQPCPHCGRPHADDQLRCPVTDMPLALAGRVLDAKFRLVRQLGSGGMASVWLATNVLVDKAVAIKLIRPDLSRDSDTMARFRNEARAAGRIGSRHICDIFDFGQSPIGPYIVMELLQGENLGQLIQRKGKLDPGLATAIARDALAGLKAAHQAGIVHRDLKPENIFLHRREDGSMIVKLMDFGVSKFTDGSSDVATAHGMLLGTPQFMAPEQVHGATNADVRTDIWAIGAILYRALTGKDAFLGSTVPASLMKVASEQAVPIRDIAPEIPSALVEVIDRCLQKDPNARFQSADELSKALAAFTDDGAFQGLSAHARAHTSVSLPTVLATEGEMPLATTQPAKRTRPWLRRAIPVVLMLVGGGLAWILIAPVLRSPSDAGEDDSEAVATVEEPPSRPTGTPTGTQPVDDDPAAEDADHGRPLDTDEVDARPGTDAASPRKPPGASADTEAGETEAPRMLEAEGWRTLAERGPVTTHSEAKTYCRLLASQGHLDIDDWSLANPAQAKRFEDHAKLPQGRYWTTARWRGKALTYVLPAGRKVSVRAGRKGARPFCVSPPP